MFDLIVQFLTQLGGGPGAAENNLVRFGLPALFWAVLFLVAWSRRRGEKQPREGLLLFGFGLFFAREFFMFLHTAEKIYIGQGSPTQIAYVEPLEHALAVSAVIVISAAFMYFMLDQRDLPLIYLILGFGFVGIGLLVSFLAWPDQQAANPSLNFHNTVGGWLMHLTKVVFIAAAIIILIRHKGWIRNVVIVALSFLLGSVLLTMINSLTGRAYDFVLCPVSNNLHIWAVPIFGFVYFREQSLAKKKAEYSLAQYRNHLERLVDSRTAELSTANEQLHLEVVERKRAERAAEQWAIGMSRLHEMSLLLNTTLEPDEIYQLIVSQASALLGGSAAGLFCLDEGGRTVTGVASYGMIENGVDGMHMPVAGNEVLEDLIASNEVLVVEDAPADSRIPPSLWKRYPLRAVVGLPVRGTANVQGLLFVVDPRPRNWQTAEVRLLHNFANRAGLALENAYLHRQVEWAAALEERQRIAAEMHDGLAQVISMLALRNDQAAQMIEAGHLASAMEELSDIQGIISLAGNDLRRSIASLREKPEPPCSLQDALSSLLISDCINQDPRCRFACMVSAPLYLPSETQDQITNIVQEALINACKHSCADKISISLTEMGNGHLVTVEDDGQGFDVETAEHHNGNHFGLSIMRARAQRVGGELIIDSSPGAGTRLLLSWPEAAVSDADQYLNGDSSESIDDSEKILWQN